MVLAGKVRKEARKMTWKIGGANELCQLLETGLTILSSGVGSNRTIGSDHSFKFRCRTSTVPKRRETAPLSKRPRLLVNSQSLVEGSANLIWGIKREGRNKVDYSVLYFLLSGR